MMKLDKIRSANLLGDFTPEDQEWHDLRKQGITGTDVGAILGVSPFSSAYKIWAVKTGLVTDEVKQNQSMRLGQLLEPALLQMFKETHPEMQVHEVGTYAHEDYPFMIANPDGLAIEGDKLWIVEIKTSRKYWEEVPAHYITQVLHYADVFSADGIKMVSYAGGNFQEWEIPFSEFELEAQREAVKDFWEENIQQNIEPSWDGSQATYEVMREIARPGDPEVSVDLGYLGVQLANAQEEAQRTERELRQLKSAALAQMGDAKFGMVGHEGEEYLVATKRQRGEGKVWLEIK
jgi:putative phage-type endonuclease